MIFKNHSTWSFSRVLLKTLDRPEIKEKIIDIVFGENPGTRQDTEKSLEEQKVLYETLQTEYAALEQEKGKVTQERDEKETDIIFLKEKNEDLLTRLEKQSTTSRNLKTAIDTLKVEKEDLTEKMLEMGRDIDQHRSENERQRKLIDEQALSFHELQEKYKTLKDKNRELTDSKAEMELHLKENKVKYSDISKTLESYRDSFDDIKKAFLIYRGLPSSTRESLINVISSDTEQNFIVSGTQWDNVKALWEFISYKYESLDAKDLQGLTDVFYFVFSACIKVDDRYSLLKIQPGDIMDEDLHTRSKSGRVTGKVKKIILRGYRDVKNDRIEQKSIVEVE